MKTEADGTQDGSELDQHVVFFDVDRDGNIEKHEIAQAMAELGFGSVVTALVTPILWLAAGGEVSRVRNQRHDDSGSFRKDGHFDEQAFSEWFATSDTDGSDSLSRFEILKASVRLSKEPFTAAVSSAEFQLVHALLAKDGSLSRADLESFLDGSFFREIVEARAAAAGS